MAGEGGGAKKVAAINDISKSGRYQTTELILGDPC